MNIFKKAYCRIFKRIPLLFAIPTTAGTGTETTVATVITDLKTKHKYMISDFPLIPKYAVLDPVVTKTLPPNITASCGMDVLVHAIEAYIGNSTTRKTRSQALKATKLVYQNLLKAYEKEAAKIFIQSIKDLNSKMQIGNKIESIKKEDIKKLARYAHKEANPIYPVPVLMNKNELEKFYYNLI